MWVMTGCVSTNVIYSIWAAGIDSSSPAEYSFVPLVAYVTLKIMPFSSPSNLGKTQLLPNYLALRLWGWALLTSWIPLLEQPYLMPFVASVTVQIMPFSSPANLGNTPLWPSYLAFAVGTVEAKGSLAGPNRPFAQISWRYAITGISSRGRLAAI
jgi:hypothetical protein